MGNEQHNETVQPLVKNHGQHVRIYKGDTFKQLIRQVAYDKMTYDPKYRRDVIEAREKTRKSKAGEAA